MRKIFLAAIGLAATLGMATAYAADEAPLPQVQWSWQGPLATYDRAALQRGFQIYQEVCANCHSLNLLHYRDLADLGYTDDQIKVIAAKKQVDTVNDQGDVVKRPARPADAFVPPFANDQAARAANNGALPPDQSLLVKAREGGPDYIYGILTEYKNPPAGFKMNSGMNYNEMFPGHQIAMPQPLSDNTVTYDDGTKATLDQEARDIVAFLTWAADPKMEERKKTGFKAMLFLVAMTGVLYGAKRKIWSDVH
jgi:ubiquinol-cytochrome c reductase cytochrome c1 subunit